MVISIICIFQLITVYIPEDRNMSIVRDFCQLIAINKIVSVGLIVTDCRYQSIAIDFYSLTTPGVATSAIHYVEVSLEITYKLKSMML